jgi:hypothetical protein
MAKLHWLLMTVAWILPAQTPSTFPNPELILTKTDDGILLAGGLWFPPARESSMAIILVAGGARSEFYAMTD